MSSETLRVLLVEDDEDDFVLTRSLLGEARGVKFALEWASTVEDGLAALRGGAFDAVLLDYYLGGASGLDFLDRLRSRAATPPVLLLTGVGDDGVDMAAMRAGAADFLVKSEITPLLLERAVRYAVQQHRSEQALRESEERFRQLAENIGAVFWLYDLAQERTVYVSPAYERIWARALDELYADPGVWLRTVHPEDAEALAGVMGTVEPYELEYRIVRPDGEVRWIRDRGFPIRDAHGAAFRTAGIAEDITERRAAQDTLASREAYFRALMENAQDLVVSLDLEGKVRDHSPSVERLLGYSYDELHGRNIFEIIHPEDVGEVLGAFMSILDQPGASVTREYRIQMADGGWRILESTGYNLVQHPAVGAVVVNSHDVTERRQAEQELRASEEQLRQSQKLEAVGRLAGGIAHDFNNLLTAIQGNAEMLLMEAPETGPLREDLMEIKRASIRAAGLTRQLLAFSRKQMLAPKVLDLNASVREMERMLGRLLGEDVPLVTRLNARASRVKADPGQLEQVIMNLAVNGRDALPRGGILVIETTDARLTEEDSRRYPYSVVPGPYVQLAVCDEGVGMPPEVLARVFEPFFTTKEPGHGTGLGLSTVYGIVKQSGGYVWVDSEPGRGTTFRVYLPAVDAEPDRLEPVLHVLDDGGPRSATILLVEDEDAVRTLARKILERKGYAVLDARCRADARQAFEQAGGRIDLLLTDVVMPEGSGRELAEELLAVSPGLRVVFMSGYTDDALIRHGVLESRFRLIQKPFTPDALWTAVGEALEKGSA
jgi:PAS domain S-box-containing protein